MPNKLIAHKGSYRLTALASGAVELYIYGPIGSGWWADTGVEALDIINQLQAIQANEIIVHIASDGGSVNEGLAIFNALRRHPAAVTTVNDSIAASIASLIFCAGDIRIMPANTMLMLHGVIGDGGIGNATQIRERADQIDMVSKIMLESYAMAVGTEQRSAIEEMLLDGNDHYLTAEEALGLGLCTAINDALPLAAVRRVDLSRLKHLPAAAAVFNSKVNAMNYKLLALALSLAVSTAATDDEYRKALLKHLALADSATDAEIETAMAARQATAAVAATATATPVATVAAISPASRVRGMFAAALQGQADNASLLALQRRINVDLESGAAVDVEGIRGQIMATIQVPAQSVAGRYTAVEAGDDQRDKYRAAGAAWLMVRSSVARRDSQEARDIGSNPFRGMSFADMARVCLENAGVNTRSMNRHDILSMAITHSTSDFPNIFENALHKTLLAAFALAPTTWDKVCKIGTLADFRPHIRYRSASFGDLQVVQEDGEFKTITLSDAERETISAKTRGGILNVSREMLVNDDMGVFSDLATGLGRSASRTREKALYTLLAQNGGLGPLMGDGKTLIHADHGNISGSAGAPSVETIDADRQTMASQMDPSANDFVDIRPTIFLGPLSLGGNVRVINNAQYDPDTPNKLQKPNKVAGLYSQVIDTPRLSGTPWFSLADPNVEPVFEMGFLDGQQTPQIAMEEAFSQHGMKWRIVDEWGLAAVGYRGIIRNAGA